MHHFFLIITPVLCFPPRFQVNLRFSVLKLVLTTTALHKHLFSVLSQTLRVSQPKPGGQRRAEGCLLCQAVLFGDEHSNTFLGFAILKQKSNSRYLLQEQGHASGAPWSPNVWISCKLPGPLHCRGETSVLTETK